jgi:hypothetical protein
MVFMVSFLPTIKIVGYKQTHPLPPLVSELKIQLFLNLNFRRFFKSTFELFLFFLIPDKTGSIEQKLSELNLED